jgi:multidrug efflux system membrane fusion protein
LIAALLLASGAALYWMAPRAGGLPGGWEQAVRSLDVAVLRAHLWPAVAEPAARGPGSPVKVSAAPVLGEDVPITLTSVGTVQAYGSVSVKSRVDGEIAEILFREGQDVKAGDPLAVVDPRPLQAQLRQQEASRLKNEALLEGAMLDLRRFENLVARNHASQQQVDRQRTLVEQYRAQVKADEAHIDYARTHLAYTTIRSPISGRTGIRQVDRGNIVRAAEGTTIVVVSQIQPISVLFAVSVALAAQNRLTPGEAALPVAAYAADDVTLLDRGIVEAIDNQADPATGTIRLKARFPNEMLRLWPGYFVNGRITVDIRRNAASVPASAVRHGPRGDFVWVVRPDNTVEYRAVTAGQTANGRTLVERGVKAGEVVVTEGHFRLEAGTRVEVTQTEPRPPASSAKARTAPEAQPASSAK